MDKTELARYIRYRYKEMDKKDLEIFVLGLLPTSDKDLTAAVLKSLKETAWSWSDWKGDDWGLGLKKVLWLCD